MRTLFLALALAAGVLPIAVNAQGMPGMTPELQAKLQQARSDAKTASFAALSADHRTKVQAIVDQVNAGSLEPPDAVTQIDAILTPDESKAVLDQMTKFRDAMRAAFAQANPGSPAPAPMNRPGGQQRPPDAGRALLMFSIDFAAMQQRQ